MIFCSFHDFDYNRYLEFGKYYVNIYNNKKYIHKLVYEEEFIVHAFWIIFLVSSSIIIELCYSNH